MQPAPFTIADVGDILGIRRLDGGDESSFGVECPFCGDSRGKCNFSVMKSGRIKNVYRCFNCGAQGNMLTLFADLMGLWGNDRYKEAYQQIKEKQQYGGQETRTRREQLERRAEAQKEKCAEPAGCQRRDQVYRALIRMLHLSEAHRKDLHRRGQTEEEIQRMEERGYVSTAPQNSVTIARRLIKQGHDLEGIPGFFVNRGGDWEINFYRKNSGYLCPAWSEEGLLVAFQIRLDEPYGHRKYIWLTSAKLKKGCSSGCPVGVSGNPYAKCIYVTEGVLKAEITYQRSKRTYLGNPGVGNYKELGQMLRVLKERGLEEVIEANDMEKMMRLDCHEDYGDACRTCDRRGAKECPKKREKRDNIRKGCLNLYRICGELDITCRRQLWDSDGDGMWLGKYKGCDDWELKGRDPGLEEQAA